MSDQFELLYHAIERNTSVVLLLPLSGLEKPHRSRLLSIGDEGVLLESVPGQAEAIDELIRVEQPVTVSFRAGAQNVEFAGAILRRFRGYRLNATTQIEALLLRRPTAVRAVQRRSDYRVSVPHDSGIQFKFWRLAEQANLLDDPAVNTLMDIDVRDFSAGGCGGTWKRRKDDPRIAVVGNQRLRVEIDGGQAGKALLEARLRFLDPLHAPELRHVGVQFTINDSNFQDRHTVVLLNKLVGELQRTELRRQRIAR